MTDKEKRELDRQVSEVFNDLPEETRKQIRIFTTNVQLRTLMQARARYKGLISPALDNRIKDSEDCIAEMLSRYLKDTK